MPVPPMMVPLLLHDKVDLDFERFLRGRAFRIVDQVHLDLRPGYSPALIGIALSLFSSVSVLPSALGVAHFLFPQAPTSRQTCRGYGIDA